MIDFRYHIVSIVAIFLALAIGIVLGSTVLKAPLVASTEKITAQLRGNNDELRARITIAERRGGASDAFIASRLPQLVQGALAGERVVLVETPGADSKLREPITQVLEEAGAVVSGRVTLTDKYLRADQAGAVDQLATTAKPGDVAYPASATPYDKAAAVLASAIVTSRQVDEGKENPLVPGVLQTFEKDGLVTLDGDPAKRATLAVMIAPATAYEGEDAEAQNSAIISLAGGLDDGGKGTVVVGVVPTSATLGVLAAVRSSDVSQKVSTVDNVDMASGQAVVVYSLREQVAGEVGQYGLGSDATTAEPPPTPTPTPTVASGG